jgi:hypothetical protein
MKQAALIIAASLLASLPFLAADPRGSGVYYPPIEIVINTQPFFDYQVCKRTPSCARSLGPIRINPNLFRDRQGTPASPWMDRT